MNDFTHVRRNGRPSQNIMPKTFRMINTKPHGIPEFRHILPFVNQPRLRTYKQFIDIDIRNCQILVS